MYGPGMELFRKMPEFDSKRIYLRKMSVCDADDMFEYARKETVTKYLLWSPHPSPSATRMYLSNIQKDYSRGLHHEWAIICKSNEKMIGTVGFTRIDTINSIGEIGYVLSDKYWGMGLAAEAAEIILSIGFDYLELERIEIRYMAENIASRRVGEKLGMKYEGTLRNYMFVKNKFRDISISSILQYEYRNTHKKSNYSHLHSNFCFFRRK